MNIALCLLLFLGQQTKVAAKSATDDPVGLWMTTLDIGIQKLRLVVDIKKDKTGKYTATMDSIDQGASGIPITTLTITDNEITWEVQSIRAKFTGKRDGVRYSGEFTQGPLKLPVSMERIDKRPDLSRPQDPKKPYPYDELEVTYPNPAANKPVTLAGTLTIPKSAGPHPAAILITGSGPQNRNEELFNHRPFLVWADHLTRQGIAVLRVDDRGVGKSTGASSSDTSVDFATDVLAGVKFLKGRKEIDPRRIGLVGHSEGGMIAPMVAVQAPDDIAFLVLMAGTGVPGEDIIDLQSEKIMRATGAKDDIVEANRKIQKAFCAIVKKQQDQEAAEKEIIATLETMLPRMPELLKPQFSSKEIMKAHARAINNSWMRYFLVHDPRPVLQKVRCPVLALNGELDLQVIPDQNIPEIMKALEAGGNRKSKSVVLPKLNHLFQTSRTGHIAEYGTISETTAPVALKTMSDWIREQTGLTGR